MDCTSVSSYTKWGYTQNLYRGIVVRIKDVTYKTLGTMFNMCEC